MPENKPSGPQGENPPRGPEQGGPFFIVVGTGDWDFSADPPEPLKTECFEASSRECADLIATSLNTEQAGGRMFMGFEVRLGSTMDPAKRLLARADVARLSRIADDPPSTEDEVTALGLEFTLLAGIFQRCRDLQQLAITELDQALTSAPEHCPKSPAEVMAGIGVGQDDDSDYRPATWFKKGMAARLRMAAARDRKTKRVATRMIDGVVCYRVSDARQWWPTDVPTEP